MWGWTGLAAACMAIRDRKPYVRGDGLMVDDKTTFEQAVDALTADRKKTSFDWTAPVGGGTQKTGENDVMNALIRGALK